MSVMSQIPRFVRMRQGVTFVGAVGGLLLDYDDAQPFNLRMHTQIRIIIV